MNFNGLNTELNNFWTDRKCGKHDNLASQHGMLLLKNLKVDPSDYFDYLKTNTFKFQTISGISWSDFLSRAGLSHYLKEEYVNDAMNITSPRPAMGKGEFLFVSCFNNIGFAETAGDLIDLNTGDRIEVKGIRSMISGDGKKYKLMNPSIINTVFAIFNKGTNLQYFNRDCASLIEEELKQVNNDDKKLKLVLTRLQNVQNESAAVASKFASLYNINKPNLFDVVGAMQLYMYMKNIKFLLMVNDKGFKCFENTGSPKDFLNIIETGKIKISTWSTGERGMELGI